MELKAEETLRMVGGWLEEHGLTLAAEKTEAILLIGKKRCQPINIRMQGETIRIGKELKYLGVILDTRLAYLGHVEYVKTKATSRAVALAKILPRTGGLVFRRGY